MKVSVYRRIFAYLIDTMIIVFISTLLTMAIPMSESYKNASSELTQVMEKYTSGEMKEKEYLESVNDISYTLNKESIAESIVSVVISTIYFVVIAYYLNGQTPGKKLMKLRIVSTKKDKKLTMNNFLIRGLIVDSILLNIISIIIILTLKKSTYLSIYNVISNIFSFIYIATFVMILFRQDGRGLHDLIAKTKVVSVEKEKEQVEESKEIKETKEEATKEIIEEEIIEKEITDDNKKDTIKSDVETKENEEIVLENSQNEEKKVEKKVTKSTKTKNNSQKTKTNNNTKINKNTKTNKTNKTTKNVKSNKKSQTAKNIKNK